MQKNHILRTKYRDFFSSNTHSCLLSPNGYGKTLLLTNNSDLLVDLSKISVSPESFAVEFVGSILHWYSGEPVFSLSKYFDITFLLKNNLEEKSKKIIAEIHNELQKIKPDQELLLNLAFKFPETMVDLTSKKSTPLIIGLDNFQEFFSFNNFLQLSNPLKIFKKYLLDEDYSKKVNYKLCSSSINSVVKQLSFIPTLEIAPFSLEETTKLVKKHLLSLNSEELNSLHKYTSGIPCLINHFIQEKLSNQKISFQDLIFQELLDTNSFTNNYLSNSYSSSLGTAKGSALLRNLVKVLSQAPRIRLTNLAKKIYKSSPVTKSLLVRLIDADLVLKEASLFTFKTPLLRVWIYLYNFNLLTNNIKLNSETKKLVGDLFDY